MIRRVAAVLLRFDYGIASRGPSMEKSDFVPAMKAVFPHVSCFWLEDNGFPNDLDGLQAKIIDFVEVVKPDLVYFTLMREEITRETLDWISSRFRTINWFCDDQWRFDGYSRELAPHLSWVLTTDKNSVPRYHALGVRNVILSQWGSAKTKGINPNAVEYVYQVSFVGTKNVTRAWIVRELWRAGIAVDCFGQGWSGGRVDREKMHWIFLHSKINLNLSNSVLRNRRIMFFSIFQLLGTAAGSGGAGNGMTYLRRIRRALLEVYETFCSRKRFEQIKARNFEIPANGGFQITQLCLGLDDYFVPGEEIVTFSSVDELIGLVRHYLLHEQERKAICEQGYTRAEMHTYEKRFIDIKKRIESDMPAEQGLSGKTRGEYWPDAAD